MKTSTLVIVIEPHVLDAKTQQNTKMSIILQDVFWKKIVEMNSALFAGLSGL
jgi:hypothetical protein